jgi:hypothetical protein
MNEKRTVGTFEVDYHAEDALRLSLVFERSDFTVYLTLHEADALRTALQEKVTNVAMALHEAQAEVA